MDLTEQEKESECKFCKQPIYWVPVKGSNKKTALNPHPIKVFIQGKDLEWINYGKAYVSHHSTCPGR